MSCEVKDSDDDNDSDDDDDNDDDDNDDDDDDEYGQEESMRDMKWVVMNSESSSDQVKGCQGRWY